MERIQIEERLNWRNKASEFGFKFHTMYGQAYWDETAYYRFSLKQIEEDLEAPTQEIHDMCLAVVEQVVHDESLLKKFQIPQPYWEAVRQSWLDKENSLYSRLDFVYDGKSPAKLLENNADTPTSLYETGFWQWLWLDDKISSKALPTKSDQFNSLQEKLIERFKTIHTQERSGQTLYFSCCKETDEDRGTVQYMQDCAEEAGIPCQFVYIEDIGHGEPAVLTDLDNRIIQWMFKLYPWEFMLREEYAPLINTADTLFIEPLWKSVVSNKALLPLLWHLFPNHPNLLPAYFSEEKAKKMLNHYVKKPIFAREGSNISVIKDGITHQKTEGFYGEEGYIYQQYHPLPVFQNNHTLIGSWLVNDQPAGISVREDTSPITQDLSRFLPHVIMD